MIGKIIKHKGNKLAIEFEDEINSNFLKLLANNDDNLVKVELLDNRQMSQKQNALSHVLIADIARWSYDEPKSALMALSLTSRQILHYSFCVQDHYSNYKIAREVGYSERSIQRMKSEALIEFAEAYRNGKIIAYK